jgi:hypothetical protein
MDFIPHGLYTTKILTRKVFVCKKIDLSGKALECGILNSEWILSQETKIRQDSQDYQDSFFPLRVIALPSGL